MSEQSQALPKASLWVTVAFAVFSLVTFLLDGPLDRTFSVLSGVLFVAGTLMLGLGLWNGIQRSRVDAVTLTGLLSVDKSHVPKPVRNQLWAGILGQTAAAVLFAALRPFTEQAFGILVPMIGLGFATLWGSRFAKFFPRDDP